MKKYTIGWGQLLILLLLCRIFTLMTFVPLLGEGYTFSTQLIASVISTVIQAVMIIPIILLNKTIESKSTTEIVFSRSKILGYIISFLYFVFFIFYTANGVICFQRFITVRFYPSANRYIWTAVLLLVCIYCSYLGIEGLARSAGIVFVLFVAMFVLMTGLSAADIDLSNYYFDRTYSNSLFSAVTEDLARNGEITALAFLMKHVEKKYRCSAYCYLASKLISVEAVMFLITVVLGDFAAMTDYPFLTVGAYAGVRFIQRFDSIYMVIWTITAVINISVMMYISSGIINESFPKLKYKHFISGVIVFLLCMPFLISGKNDMPVYGIISSGYSVLLLITVIPLIIYIFEKVKSRRKRA